jgi:hypothetical protein
MDLAANAAFDASISIAMVKVWCRNVMGFSVGWG